MCLRQRVVFDPIVGLPPACARRRPVPLCTREAGIDPARWHLRFGLASARRCGSEPASRCFRSAPLIAFSTQAARTERASPCQAQVSCVRPALPRCSPPRRHGRRPVARWSPVPCLVQGARAGPHVAVCCGHRRRRPTTRCRSRWHVTPRAAGRIPRELSAVQ